MAKKLRVRDRLLLGISIVGDLYDQTAGAMYHDFYWMRRAAFWMPPEYKPQNFYQTVRKALRTGYIEKVIKDGKPMLRLTSEGKKKIQRDFSLFAMQKKSWNGRWCLVIFDIEEKDRNIRQSLREKLKELGFGQLQRSIYISPHDLIEDMVEFLSDHDILGEALVLECKHRLMGDARKLALRVWKLEELNKQYQEIFEKAKSFLTKGDISELSRTKEEYLELLTKDPFLPRELMPENWYGNRLYNLFKQIKF